MAIEALAILEPAGPGPQLARTYAELSDIASRGDEVDSAIEWGQRAICMAEEVDDAEALVHALYVVGMTEMNHEIRGGREKLERGIELGKAADEAFFVGCAYTGLTAALSQRHDWIAHGLVADAGIDYCREHGLDLCLIYLLWGKAEALLARGAWDEAADVARSILGDPAGETGPMVRRGHRAGAGARAPRRPRVLAAARPVARVRAPRREALLPWCDCGAAGRGGVARRAAGGDRRRDRRGLRDGSRATGLDRVVGGPRAAGGGGRAS